MTNNRTPAPRYFQVKPWQGAEGKLLPGFSACITQRIAERGITQRAVTTLVRLGVTTMDQLVRLTPGDMMRVRDCGRLTVNELLEFRSKAVRPGAGAANDYGRGFSDGWRAAFRFVKSIMEGPVPQPGAERSES